jgi:ABC-type transport system substrate-binding protein
MAAAGMMFPRAAHATEGTLRTRTYADIRSMDRAFSQGVVDEEIQGAIYNKLIQYTPGRDWGWQLDAARMIEQVDDTHINFALRDDIGFTNGFGAMTAEDVKFSFERIIDDTLDSTNRPDWGPISHVEVTGERTGTIVLEQRLPAAQVDHAALYRGQHRVEECLRKRRRADRDRGCGKLRPLHACRLGTRPAHHAASQPRLA